MASPSEDLQRAIYELLSASAPVVAIVGTQIIDGRPLAFPCITFGSNDYQLVDGEGFSARVETVQIHCWARDDARLRATKRLADAAVAALHGATAPLRDHKALSLRVVHTESMMDPDALTGHGIVQVECLVHHGQGV